MNRERRLYLLRKRRKRKTRTENPNAGKDFTVTHLDTYGCKEYIPIKDPEKRLKIVAKLGIGNFPNRSIRTSEMRRLEAIIDSLTDLIIPEKRFPPKAVQITGDIYNEDLSTVLCNVFDGGWGRGDGRVFDYEITTLGNKNYYTAWEVKDFMQSPN